jgi:hypothetical protein
MASSFLKQSRVSKKKSLGKHHGHGKPSVSPEHTIFPCAANPAAEIGNPGILNPLYKERRRKINQVKGVFLRPKSCIWKPLSYSLDKDLGIEDISWERRQD